MILKNKIQNIDKLPTEIKEVITSQENHFKTQIFNHIKSYYWATKNIKQSSKEDDCEKGFDIQFDYCGRNIKMGLRIRPIHYLKDFNDITFRFKTQKDNDSEWHKIKKGYGDVYYFGWYEKNKVKKYIIFDLEKMRQSNMFEYDKLKLSYNKDNSSFAYYNINELIENDCIIFKK